MKRYLLPVFLFVVLCVTLYGCKKKDLTDPVSTGYIQFKMDGQLYRFYDYNSPVGDGTVSVTQVSPTSYKLGISFGVAFSTKNPIQSVTLNQFSYAPLEAKNYVFTGTNLSESPQFLQLLTSYDRYTFVNKVTTGNVEITRLDTVAGGKVEGNFNFKNLYLQDEYNNIISTYHNVTEGQFSVVIDAK